MQPNESPSAASSSVEHAVQAPSPRRPSEEQELSWPHWGGFPASTESRSARMSFCDVRSPTPRVLPTYPLLRYHLPGNLLESRPHSPSASAWHPGPREMFGQSSYPHQRVPSELPAPYLQPRQLHPPRPPRPLQKPSPVLTPPITPPERQQRKAQHPHPFAHSSFVEANHAAIRDSNSNYIEREAKPFIDALDPGVKDKVCENIMCHMEMLRLGNFSAATESQMSREAVLAQRREMGMAPPRRGGRGCGRGARGAGRGMDQAFRGGRGGVSRLAHEDNGMRQEGRGRSGVESGVAGGGHEISRGGYTGSCYRPTSQQSDHVRADSSHGHPHGRITRCDDRRPNDHRQSSYGHDQFFRPEPIQNGTASKFDNDDDQDDEGEGGVRLPETPLWITENWRRKPDWRVKASELAG